MARNPSLTHLLAADGALLLAACGAGGPVVTGDGTTGATPSPTAAPVLDGVPGDCRLLDDEADPLRALRDGIDPGARHGPLVVTDAGSDARVLATTEYEDPVGYGDVAAWVVRTGDDAITAANEVAASISTFALDRVDTAGEGPVARALALATDCSRVAAEEARPDLAPTDPPPQVRDDLMNVTPARPAPGTVVEVTFTEEFLRGIAWNLDQRDGDGWTTRFWLTSDGNGGEPSAVPAGTEGWAVEDVGVGGTGPDRLLVPEDATPGDWRLCTANAAEDVCVPLEVTAP